MATAAITYSFVANTLITASEANTNFQDLVDFLNQDVIHKDGSVAFTAHASGPATDPSSDNQYSRKAYVDAQVPTVQRFQQANSGSVLGANDTVALALYPTGGLAVPAAGGACSIITVELELDTTAAADEIIITPQLHLSGADWRIRTPVASGSAKFTETFQFYYDFSGSLTWTPQILVTNGNAPVSVTIGAVAVTHIFTRGGTVELGAGA